MLISDDETGEGRRMVVLRPIVKVDSESKPLGDIIVPRLQLNVYKERFNLWIIQKSKTIIIIIKST